MEKILYISSKKNKKIEDIFQGCLRFLDSKGTNGSAPNTDISISFNYLLKAFFASSASAVNAAASVTARSANILRLISIPATFKPCINLE